VAATQPNPAHAKETGPPWRVLPLVLLLVAVGAVFATGLHRSFRISRRPTR
jgi:hypothetical protein